MLKNSLAQTLFPSQPRYFRGERWVNIGLRSAHLVGIAGIGGGFLLDVQPAAWKVYWYLTLATGLMLSALYLWNSVAWLFEFKGLAIILKNLLLGIALIFPALGAEIFTFIIVLSGFMAHAPAGVRGAQWVSPPFLPDQALASANAKPRHRRQ